MGKKKKYMQIIIMECENRYNKQNIVGQEEGHILLGG